MSAAPVVRRLGDVATRIRYAVCRSPRSDELICQPKRGFAASTPSGSLRCSTVRLSSVVAADASPAPDRIAIAEHASAMSRLAAMQLYLQRAVAVDVDLRMAGQP